MFDLSAQLIDEVRNRNKGVLVVCTAGVSRSASLVSSYLMKTMNLSTQEAIKLVKSSIFVLLYILERRFINPNKGSVSFSQL